MVWMHWKKNTHVRTPGSLKLSLGIGLSVVERERLATGRGRRAQAGTVPDGEPERHENPWGGLPVEKGRRQPVVLDARILVDIADFEGTDEFALIIQNAHLIPLGNISRENITCQSSPRRGLRGIGHYRGL